MKNTIKSLFIRILTVLMLITVFTVPSVKQVDAASKGSSISNPVVMTSGKTFTKTWNNNTTGKNFYNKVTVPARGVVQFTINKPLNYNDEYGSYDIIILNSKGSELINFDTSMLASSSGKNVSYKIGLAKGTYFFNVICHSSYYSSSGRKSHTVNYLYKYTKTSAWEAEPNNTKKKANKLTLGQVMSGEYCDEDYDSGTGSSGNGKYCDYFKVALKKGVSYRFSIQNYKALDSTSWLGQIVDANDNVVLYTSSTTYSLVSGKFRYWDFTAPSTGTFYVKFWNCGYRKPVQYKIKISKSPAKTWKKMNGYWYYFNGSNKLAVGWQKVGKKWYYFNTYGEMQYSRWIYTGNKKSFLGADGAMLTGWQKISNGDNTWSWYYLGTDGYAHTGWLHLGGNWYYLTSAGKMVYGGYWYVNGTKYIFDKNGVCQNP